jgi:hypothetical protein
MKFNLAGGWRPAAALLGAGLATLILMPRPAVAAESPDLLGQAINVSLGTFLLEQDTKVQLNGEAGPGTPLDWERTFGDQDSTRFRVDAFWRFADRHKLRFLWFNNSTDSARDLEEDVDWGGVTYPVGARINAEFDLDVYELAYEYAFLRRDNWEVSASVGLHWTSMLLALSGTVQVGGEDPVSEEARREGSVDLPLPVLGLRGLWNIGGAFWFDASAQYFALSIDDVDGSLSDLRVAAVWQPRRWLGLGLGYNRFAVDVDVDTDKFNGTLDWAYQGPMLFLSGTF